MEKNEWKRRSDWGKVRGGRTKMDSFAHTRPIEDKRHGGSYI